MFDQESQSLRDTWRAPDLAPPTLRDLEPPSYDTLALATQEAFESGFPPAPPLGPEPYPGRLQDLADEIFAGYGITDEAAQAAILRALWEASQ